MSKYPTDRSMKRMGIDAGYWELRKNRMMYKIMRDIALRFAGEAKSAIDVGSYVGGLICDLDWIANRVASDLNDYTKEWAGVDGVQFRRVNAFDLNQSEPWDLVISNQTIEHVQDAAGFARKLCDIGKTVMVSTTYKVPAGKIEGHIQDPIDLEKFLSWFPRPAKAILIVPERPFDNIIGIF